MTRCRAARFARVRFASKLSTLAVLFILMFVAGCASTGKSTVRQAFSVSLGQFKSATVEVVSAAEKNPARINEFLVQLESRIIAKLREKGTFAKVYSQAADADAKSDVALRVIITNIRDISAFDRVMWGGLAGQANTKATVEVRERASDKLIGSGEIEGKSSGGSVMAGTTSEAVDRVADEVVRLVVDNL